MSRLPGLRHLVAASPYARWLAAITAAGAILRLAFLDNLPLWRDEAFTALASQRSLPDLIGVVRQDTAPPLHYLVIRAVALVSDSPVALRLPSVLAGTATIVLLAAVGRRLAGDAGGLWTAALVAVSPPAVLTSRDARMYALAIMLLAATLLTLLRALERPTMRRLAMYGSCACLALYTEYLSALAIAAMLAAVVLLRPHRRALAGTLAATAAAGLALLPWIAAAWGQFAHHTSFWVKPLSIVELQNVAAEFFGGPQLGYDVVGRTPSRIAQGAAIAAALVALAALLAGLRHLGNAQLRLAAALAAAGGLGLALLIAVSVREPLLQPRYAAVVTWPLLPLIGGALALVRWRAVAWAQVGGTAVAAALLLGLLTRPDIPGVAGRLDGQVGQHDLVVVTTPADYLLVLYYDDATARARTILRADSVPWFWGTAVYPPGGVQPRVDSVDGTIWVIGDPGSGLPLIPPDHIHDLRWCPLGVCLDRFSAASASTPGP